MSIENLSADEIMELYRKKVAEEEAAKQQENENKIKELQVHKAELVAEHKKAVAELNAAHKKAIAEIDKEIKKLGGKASAGGRKKVGGKKDSISSKILEMLGAHGRLSAKAIKENLEGEGHEVKYLHQRLAHLKRTKQIASPERGYYELG